MQTMSRNKAQGFCACQPCLQRVVTERTIQHARNNEEKDVTLQDSGSRQRTHHSSLRPTRLRK